MPVLNSKDAASEEISKGVQRRSLVDGTKGAKSLSVAEVTVGPGGRVPNHTHPTEEAMVVLEGKLEAVLGDGAVEVGPGETVLAPAGIRHGFVNRSRGTAKLMAIFPTSKVERTFVD